MWNKFIANFDFNILNIKKQDMAKVGYDEYEGYRTELKKIGGYLKQNNSWLKQYSHKLNQSPNQSYWQEGCLRLYFCKNEATQYSFQINIEFWSSGELNIFLREQNGQVLPKIKNNLVLFKILKQYKEKGYRDFENMDSFVDKQWIGKTFGKDNLPDEIRLISVLNELVDLHHIIEECHLMEKSMEFINSNKQIILTGAPGTGKSYTSKKLAAELTNTVKDSEEYKMQVEFVQFHPSYDYTDFMEGIKPYTTVENNMSFNLKNGVFKEFCRKAGFIERIIFKLFESGSSKSEKVKLDWDKIEKECQNSSEPSAGFWAVKVSEYRDQKIESFEKLLEKLPKFVFIIDEINRAELSKVFGELMYSLEPDYRGSEGKVKTQYSKLNTEDTFFVNKDDDWFFIPSNVYIIGTMNDIDRSVEVFDFALRRRFAWKELKANDVMASVLQSMLKQSMPEGWKGNFEDLLERAIAVNKAISDTPPKLGEHFHIGPSYFGKIAFYGHNEEAFTCLWNNHLKPLLFEYVRGTGIEDKFIENCKRAFINEKS